MADVRSVKNGTQGASDEYVEQLRQKLGTEFSDRKAAGKKKNELGKDDFIKLMSAQLKHQDPFSPLKNEEMAAQLAQFSSLEQMTNVNQNLEKMTAAQKPTENVLAASLIGKRVMTDSSRFMLAKGAQPELKFEMPADAENVQVSVVDAKGEVIREFELGSMSKGGQSIRWDGKNGKNQEVNAGEYTYRVNASDKQGVALTIDTSTAGLVSGVVFESGKAQLLVDGKKIPMEAIGRIEMDQPAKAAAAPAPAANALTDAKQNSLPSAINPGVEKNNAAQKNSLPGGISPETMNNMLSALGGSRMDQNEGTEGQSGIGQPNQSMPLWNPANL